MLTVQVNTAETKELIKRQIADLVKEVDAEMIFWNSNELMRRTCMSWNTMQDTFFNDPRMPKRKVGGKWYFPARETRAFLEQWILEQG